VQIGTRVLDLGCGDGQLLERLQRERQVLGQGIEIAANAVLAATRRGVSVFQADLGEGLSRFPDGSYDVVILEETLQTLPSVLSPLSVTHQTSCGRGRDGCLCSFSNCGHGLPLDSPLPMRC